MPKSHAPPTSSSPQYILDVVWLKAFRDCGWSGKRAIAAADKAVNRHVSKLS